MHVLIIPSEEFIPDDNPMDGIFQYHQAVILKDAGLRVGVLSVRLSFSVPMILKGIAFKLVGKKAGNETDSHTLVSLVQLGFQRSFLPKRNVRHEEREGLQIVRAEGLFLQPPADNYNHKGWIRAGLMAYLEYVRLHGTPRVIHAHNALYAGMLAREIKKRYGVPFVLTEHSSRYGMNQVDETVRRRVKQVYVESERLFAVSPAFQKLLNNMFSLDRFEYLPNVLDPYLEGKPFDMRGKEHGACIFLNIASLIAMKDQALLIRAFKQVAAAAPRAELWIGGQGLLWEELHALVEREGLSGRVRFLGKLNRDEVVSALSQANCFVLSSKYETFGVVVIEAMLFGTPVITTRCSGPESFITKAVGRMVENEDQMAAAMLEMTRHTQDYQPERIRAYAIEQFGKKQFARRMKEIYAAAVPEPEVFSVEAAQQVPSV